jgi:alpha-galactosidase
MRSLWSGLAGLGIVGLLFITAGPAWAGQNNVLTKQAVAASPARIALLNGGTLGSVVLSRKWNGSICRSSLTNKGNHPVLVRQVVLFSIPLSLPSQTGLYGEGFQMLSQTGGTLEKPVDLGYYTDRSHYKIPQPNGATTVYNLLMLRPPSGSFHLLAFSSCRRFAGKFSVYKDRIDVVLDTENLALAPGETWNLEEFMLANGQDRDNLLTGLASRMQKNHPRRAQFKRPPTGWCSWYCFGPSVTAAQVLENLDFIAKNIPQLKYVQIDDGYQSAMGDWLESGKAFGGDVRKVLKQIKERGFEPAIWVAPFIAEEDSQVFKEHPDWFVKDDSGKPLKSSSVTFGGWRHGPWYALDGTHPEAQKHLETVFRTMREEWGCTYFKLDANFWGAIHGGNFHDPKATRVEAYRRGMEAVRRGAGDSFILGCNHPLWPSLGLIDGSRSSMDVTREWSNMAHIARENLLRAWQNGRLWWNDPDAVVLTGDLSEEEFRFHATVAYASGGMVLSGDDLPKLVPARLEMLRKLSRPTGATAQFADDSLRVGVIGDRKISAVCLFNWEDTPQPARFEFPGVVHLKDYWTGEDLGVHREFSVNAMPPHSARLLVVEAAK